MTVADVIMNVLIYGGVLAIILVAMALRHNRKMAELALRTKAADDQNAEGLRALQASVKELREELHAQVITMDSLISNQAKLLESPVTQERPRGRLGGEDKP